MSDSLKPNPAHPFAIILRLFAQELICHSAQFEKNQIKEKRDPKRCLATLGLLEKITDQNLGKVKSTSNATPLEQKAAGMTALLDKVSQLPKKKMFYEGINQHFQRAPSRNISQAELLRKSGLASAGPLSTLGGKLKK